MAHSVPVEIWLEVLQCVLYPSTPLGYYVEFGNADLSSQKDALNLASTCRSLRNMLGSKLWQSTHIDIYIGDSRKKLLPKGYKLLSKQRRPGDPCLPFLNCPWNPKYKASYYDRSKDDFAFMCYGPSSRILSQCFDTALTYVKTFKITSDSYELYSRGGFSNNGAVLDKYLLALSLVDPLIMPMLENLELEMIIDRFTEGPLQKLSQKMWSYDRKINLSLTASSLRYFLERYHFFPIFEYIYPWRMIPFELDFDLPSVNTTTVTAEYLPSSQGFTFSNEVLDSVGFVFPFSFFTMCMDSSITYLDLTNVRKGMTSALDWIPSTVRVLKCTMDFIRPNQDEKGCYEALDNITDLTLNLSLDTSTHSDGTWKLHFRNLTELHITRCRHLRNRTPHMAYFAILRELLESNHKSLRSLCIEYLYSPEYELISNHLDGLHNLEYAVVLELENFRTNAKFLSKIMTSSWSQNLRQLNCQIDASQISEPDPIYIDYGTLRSRVLAHPKLEFNAVQFPSSLFTRRTTNLSEKTLFGSSFDESSDSKYFQLKDFCTCADSSLFNNELSQPLPLPYPIIRMFMNFDKLRALISKAQTKRESIFAQIEL